MAFVLAIQVLGPRTVQAAGVELQEVQTFSGKRVRDQVRTYRVMEGALGQCLDKFLADIPGSRIRIDRVEVELACNKELWGEFSKVGARYFVERDSLNPNAPGVHRNFEALMFKFLRQSPVAQRISRQISTRLKWNRAIVAYCYENEFAIQKQTCREMAGLERFGPARPPAMEVLPDPDKS